MQKSEEVKNSCACGGHEPCQCPTDRISLLDALVWLTMKCHAIKRRASNMRDMDHLDEAAERELNAIDSYCLEIEDKIREIHAGLGRNI